MQRQASGSDAHANTVSHSEKEKEKENSQPSPAPVAPSAVLAKANSGASIPMLEEQHDFENDAEAQRVREWRFRVQRYLLGKHPPTVQVPS